MRDPFAPNDEIDWDRMPRVELQRWLEQQRWQSQNHPTSSVPYRSIVGAPHAWVTRNAALSHPASGVAVAFPWDQLLDGPDFASGGMWDPNQPTRLTCRPGGSGLYRFSARALFNPTGTYIVSNGVNVVRPTSASTVDQHNGTNTGFEGLPCAGHVRLNEGDYLEMTPNQLSGGALPYFGPSLPYNHMSVEWIRP